MLVGGLKLFYTSPCFKYNKIKPVGGWRWFDSIDLGNLSHTKEKIMLSEDGRSLNGGCLNT